jgi:Holliday junction resolvase-like predicted endonuclease
VNTSALHQKRALNSEIRALIYFLDKNHRLLYHRKKVFGVEIDFVLHDEDSIQFVEVKTYTSLAMAGHRLGQKQKSRLLHAKTFFESTYGIPTQVFLILVKGQDIDEFVVG